MIAYTVNMNEYWSIMKDEPKDNSL